MGKIGKGTKCSVKGCEDDAVRSLDIGKVKQAGVNAEGEKRAYLCKDHYKDFQKPWQGKQLTAYWFLYIC